MVPLTKRVISTGTYRFALSRMVGVGDGMISGGMG